MSERGTRQPAVTPAADTAEAVAVTGIRGRPMTLPAVWPTFLIGIVATALAWYRVPSGQRDTLYAEDGLIFVYRWAVGGNVPLLWEPYAGYQHLIPRIVSWFVTAVFPPAWWGVVVTVLSCAIVGTVAALVFRFSADVIGYLPARVVVGLVVVLIPIAGEEPLGNLANLHWFLLYLFPWLLMAVPRSRAGWWVNAVIALAVAMTEPQCLVFAPLVLWRFLTFPRARWVIVAWAAGMAGQALTYLTAPRVSVPGRPPWLSVAEGYVLDAGMSIVTSRGHVLGWVIVHVGWWVGFLWVLGIFAFAGVGVVLGRAPARAMLLSLVLASVASWGLSYIINNDAAQYFSTMPPEQLLDPRLVRWGVTPSMMLAAAIAITAAVLVERHVRLWPVALTVLTLMMLAMVADLTYHRQVVGLSWSEQVDAAEPQCAANPDLVITIDTQPEDWRLGLPCQVVDG